VLDCFEINCICSSPGASELWAFLRWGREWAVVHSQRSEIRTECGRGCPAEAVLQKLFRGKSEMKRVMAGSVREDVMKVFDSLSRDCFLEIREDNSVFSGTSIAFLSIWTSVSRQRWKCLLECGLWPMLRQWLLWIVSRHVNWVNIVVWRVWVRKPRVNDRIHGNDDLNRWE
jgi:hypothetical protein